MSKQFKCVSFNCLGYKSSAGFIEELCKEYDICFLSEHWLRPSELNSVQSLYKDKYVWTHLKSSVNPEMVCVGRPHGGVGFMCREMKDVTYQILQVDSDRVCAIQVIVKEEIVLTCIGVYMPFNNGSKDQLDLYIEILDLLQHLLNTYGEISPVVLSVDFNAALPQSSQLARNWYQRHPFSKQSAVLYEFLSSNDLYVANFDFKQKVNYTYFKENVKSYIDHCILSNQLRDKISKCSILSSMDSTSDHFPVDVIINVVLKQCHINEDAQSSVPAGKYINWNNKCIRDVYSEELSKLVKNLEPPSDFNIDTVICTSTDLIQSSIDIYYENIVNRMHKAAEIAVSKVTNIETSHNKHFRLDKREKHWWNSECINTRNRHRFWFKIWRSCDKPREGAVSHVYKYSKHIYRKACRNAINGQINKKFKDVDSLFLKAKKNGCLLE